MNNIGTGCVSPQLQHVQVKHRYANAVGRHQTSARIALVWSRAFGIHFINPCHYLLEVFLPHRLEVVSIHMGENQKGDGRVDLAGWMVSLRHFTFQLAAGLAGSAELPLSATG